MQSLLRRQGFSTPPPRTVGRHRRLAVLAVACFLSTTLGATGAMMMTESREVDRLALLRADAQVAIARAMESQLRQEREEISQLVQQGSASQQELRELDTQLSVAKEDRQIAESIADEVRLRGASARDDFGAQRVEGRDFVAERIAIKRVAEQSRLEDLLIQYESLQAVESTAIPPEDLEAVQQELEVTKRRVALLEALHKLRDKMVDDLIFQRTNLAELKAMQLRRQAELDILAIEEAAIADRLSEVKQLVEDGAASRRTLHRAEHEQRIYSLRMTLLRTELDVLAELVSVAEATERERT